MDILTPYFLGTSDIYSEFWPSGFSPIPLNTPAAVCCPLPELGGLACVYRSLVISRTGLAAAACPPCQLAKLVNLIVTRFPTARRLVYLEILVKTALTAPGKLVNGCCHSAELLRIDFSILL
ncbi:unnamed protein product [Protopolystoma xenopodis]|uniref:Uncharacterized protein n=1 Tax=Protopolystoma xenopodis TaxID=117903 RepID=A0A3S5AMW2_9PLAT|nr:unnamed protein product [Protopolystoma xenopodis]